MIAHAANRRLRDCFGKRNHSRRRRVAGASAGPALRADQPAGRHPGAGAGSRAEQAVALIRETSGTTIPQLAEKLGIQSSYLYRVVPKLVSEGLTTRDGSTLHPAAIKRRPRPGRWRQGSVHDSPRQRSRSAPQPSTLRSACRYAILPAEPESPCSSAFAGPSCQHLHPDAAAEALRHRVDR